MAAKITVSGDKALVQALRRLTRIDRTVIKPALEVAIRPMAQEAQTQAPASTGTLASSLVTRVTSRKGRSRASVIWRRTNVKYGAFVALGTKFKPEDDFLGHAFRDTYKRSEDLLIQGMVKGISKEWNG